MKFLFIFILFPFLLLAQTETIKGIHFEQGLTWEQVKAKAKTENKYIFIDAFATWCAPCKYMDKNIYSIDSIGDYMNAKFISVKVQMDTTKQDEEFVRQWYADAHAVQQEFKVIAFPSYLFFSPLGKIVHKGIGAKNDKAFFSIALDATNPNRQYYTLSERYRQGKKDYGSMLFLAQTAKGLKEKEFADTVARDFMDNYLFTLTEDHLFTKENIQFISSFIQSSKERGFVLLYQQADKVDKIMESESFAQGVIDRIITKEEINPIIDVAKNSEEPDWKMSSKRIRKKYSSSYADRNVLNAKVRFYSYKKNWKKYTKNLVDQIERYGVGTSMVDFNLNNYAFEVFLHSNNKYELSKALSWSEQAIQISSGPYASQLDTKANLLYKLGRIEEAILLEEKAAKLEPNAKDIQETLEKMRKGEPTWSKE